jgi:hypothetical protein
MATNYTGQLTTPAAPNTGTPGNEYEQRYFSQTFANMGGYFQRVTGIIAALFGPRGGKYINIPYGAFQDGTNQTAANTTTAYPVTFDTTDFSNGVTLSNSSRLNVAQPGLYNLQFSIQIKNTTNSSADVDFWFRKNGTDIAKSNSRFGISARKSSGDPSHVIVALNFFVSLAANDYVQIVWRTSDVAVTIETFAAGTSPTRPSIPSVIATMSFVSNLSTETA